MKRGDRLAEVLGADVGERGVDQARPADWCGRDRSPGSSRRASRRSAIAAVEVAVVGARDGLAVLRSASEIGASSPSVAARLACEHRRRRRSARRACARGVGDGVASPVRARAAARRPAPARRAPPRTIRRRSSRARRPRRSAARAARRDCARAGRRGAGLSARCGAGRSLRRWHRTTPRSAGCSPAARARCASRARAS